MSGYNGWANWETWNFALWHIDQIQEIAQEEYIGGNLNDVRAVSKLAQEHWHNVRDNTAEFQDVGWVNDVVDGYESSINWQEIAEHIWDDVVQQ